MKTRKKLIEVALPLEAINEASVREKSIRHGHPSTLHLWWARRPLAAARAVIFSQMVDDPSEYVDTLLARGTTSRAAAERELRRRKLLFEARTEKADDATEPQLEEVAIDLERQRLFRIIEDLVQWENTTNEEVLQRARDEIWTSWRRTCADNADHPRAKELFDRDELPAFHDPFAGGGALPLEAQRLGLEAHASDLNPVAVLINKAMIEIPPRFAGHPPIHPGVEQSKAVWHGAEGLAEDVRYYGKWMRDEAEKRIGHLYPKVEITAEMGVDRPDLKPYVGQKLTAIAWIWARTVKSPNPAFRDVHVPLASTFLLSTKKGKEAYLQPVVTGSNYEFAVRTGNPGDEGLKVGTKTGRGANFKCLLSGATITADYVKQQGRAGKIGMCLIAIVADTGKRRVYLPASANKPIAIPNPSWIPELRLPADPRNFWTVQYGIESYSDLFTARQLVALDTFSAVVQDARSSVLARAKTAGLPDPQHYADAITLYLAFSISKAADRNTSLCFWEFAMDRLRGTFGRQVIPMIWDFAETNPFAGAGGDIYGTTQSLCEVIDKLPASQFGEVAQADAATLEIATPRIVSTDPPYYDNVAYADLSEFFYVWLRKNLRDVFPELLATITVPKDEEIVASPYRQGGAKAAEEHFLSGMREAMSRLRNYGHPGFPISIYYAFKQADRTDFGGVASTGWETFLRAVIESGLSISGTWPMRTEQLAGLKGKINALASSIILICNKRSPVAPVATLGEFQRALVKELPQAIKALQEGGIAPVDLQQASIGPGMAIFTRYGSVLDAAGQPIGVREALGKINEVLTEILMGHQGDLDRETLFALTWFEQYAFTEGPYGEALVLAQSKATTVESAVHAGIATAAKAKVRLLPPASLDPNWDPTKDSHVPKWEAVHHLIRRLDGGETAAAELMARLGPRAQGGRELAYLLYSVCDRMAKSKEARGYNALAASWPEIEKLAEGCNALAKQWPEIEAAAEPKMRENWSQLSIEDLGVTV